MIIGDAHDQTAFSLHQALHRRASFQISLLSIQDVKGRDKPGHDGETHIIQLAKNVTHPSA
jgi:hypothetical protein